jgi:hypothetical protein
MGIVEPVRGILEAAGFRRAQQLVALENRVGARHETHCLDRLRAPVPMRSTIGRGWKSRA